MRTADGWGEWPKSKIIIDAGTPHLGAGGPVKPSVGLNGRGGNNSPRNGSDLLNRIYAIQVVENRPLDTPFAFKRLPIPAFLAGVY